MKELYSTADYMVVGSPFVEYQTGKEFHFLVSEKSVPKLAFLPTNFFPRLSLCLIPCVM